MKTNTMLVPETLTPLADADLQKWCERKCVAQVLRKITRDDNRRASVARNPRQKDRRWKFERGMVADRCERLSVLHLPRAGRGDR